MKSNPYHYTECGLDNIYLLNGVTTIDYEGEKAVSIHDVDGLHIAIAKDIVSMPRELTGQELRFLRKELNLSQKSLARYLGREEQAVARWEKNKTDDPVADRLIRVLWLDVNEQQDLSAMQLLERLQNLDQKDHETRLFQEVDCHWKPAA